MNIVLVHGAWADGSSWRGVIGRLQRAGHNVTAPQLPLTTLADNVARLRALCAAERRGAVELLASIAGWDAALLRRAALKVASEWTHRGARDLLLDAAQIRG